MDQHQLKMQVAQAVLPYIPDNAILGIGTGSTVNCFIDALTASGKQIRAAISSSQATTERLIAADIPVIPLNEAVQLALYIDGADEINPDLDMIKGGGGALTREKIVASCAKQFICIADASKYVQQLGQFPLPVEIIPMASAKISANFSKMGGIARIREGCITDNGNYILDVSNLKLDKTAQIETEINQWPGVVTHGLFAQRGADLALISQADGSIRTYAKT